MLYYEQKIKKIKNRKESKIMKRLYNLCLKQFSKAVAATVLCIVSMAVGTISLMGPYEPEMPDTLRPKNND